jgi:hypothetical protein
MRESVPSGVLTALLRPAFVAATVMWALLLPLVPLVASRQHATPIGAALLIAVYAIGSAICHQLPERSYHLWTAQMPVCARCAGIYVGAALAAIVSSGARGVPPSATLRRTAGALSAFARSATAGRRAQRDGKATPKPLRRRARPRRGSKSVVAAEAGQPRGRGPDLQPTPGTPSTSAGERAALWRPNVARAVLLTAALPTLTTLIYEWTTGHMPAHSIRAASGVPLGAALASMILSSMPRRTRAGNQVN